MGVKGVLQCLRSITRPVRLEQYRGLTVAVDAMSWLHKGVYASDVKSLAKSQWKEQGWSDGKDERHESSSRTTGRDDDDEGDDDSTSRGNRISKRLDFGRIVDARNGLTGHLHSDRGPSSLELAATAASACVSYAMRNAEILRRDFGMEIVMVIDGGSLPSKRETEKQRASDRKAAFAEALSAEARGDIRAARRLFARACSVTHDMRHELVMRCRRAGVAFIVAPYEADAQMAKLAHSGAVDLIITEDSDLLAYGCPRILFKVDFSTARGDEIQLMRDLAINDSPSFKNWTHDMFVYMCIISGCDYCEGVPGIGIKTAHRLVRIHRTPSRIFNALRAAGRLPQQFEEAFWNAYRTFRHQRVYCSQKEVVEPLLPIDGLRSDEERKTVWPFLGAWINPHIAKGIATGVLHPSKMIPWETISQNVSNSMPLASRNRMPPQNPPMTSHGEMISDNKDIKPEQRHRANNGSPSSQRNGTADMKELFAFFPSKRRKSSDGTDRERHGAKDSMRLQSRPPLQEIYVGGKDQQQYEVVPISDQIDGGNNGPVQPIPLHFNEYSSKLVGGTFETLARRIRKIDSRAVKNGSFAVQRLRSRKVKEASESKSDNNSSAQQKHVTDLDAECCVRDDRPIDTEMNSRPLPELINESMEHPIDRGREESCGDDWGNEAQLLRLIKHFSRPGNYPDEGVTQSYGIRNCQDVPCCIETAAAVPDRMYTDSIVIPTEPNERVQVRTHISSPGGRLAICGNNKYEQSCFNEQPLLAERSAGGDNEFHNIQFWDGPIFDVTKYSSKFENMFQLPASKGSNTDRSMVLLPEKIVDFYEESGIYSSGDAVCGSTSIGLDTFGARDQAVELEQSKVNPKHTHHLTKQSHPWLREGMDYEQIEQEGVGFYDESDCVISRIAMESPPSLSEGLEHHDARSVPREAYFRGKYFPEEGKPIYYYDVKGEDDVENASRDLLASIEGFLDL